MKKNEKRMILILVIITIIAIIALVMMNNGKKEKQVASTDAPEQEVPKEEFVDVLEDGTKLNKSEQLQKAKKLEGLDITDFQLTENNNQTVLLGTITNNTNTKQGGYVADITILDKQGKKMITVQNYIGPLEPGQSTQLNTSLNLDYANAYDFTIAKAK